MLRPNETNKLLHARTRAKAKMYEYSVPLERHINLQGISLEGMLDLTIGILGQVTSENNSGNFEEVRQRLLFSAQYFNALSEAKVASDIEPLLCILSSSAYYLCGFPGSSQVLLKGITNDQIEILSPMEKIVLAVLKSEPLSFSDDVTYFEEFSGLASAWGRFLLAPSEFVSLDETTSALRRRIYLGGADKDVLLVEILRATINRRFEMSARHNLSEHSDVAVELWEPYLSRLGSIREFWPAQVKLAENGVFRGVSAVIQMPTSAGKTKATELIIRSSFLSGRSHLAVIVAPYRSLCQEIFNDFNHNFSKDEDVHVSLLSDVLQNENLPFLGQGNNVVLILTPEKLDILLKYNGDLAQSIGLVVYDEGHLFDDEKRGVKYELLLSYLKMRLPITAQVILMSAVIKNASEVKEWLTGEGSVLVDSQGLNPTSRNIAFVEWTHTSRNLWFVDENDVSRNLFFVPTVLNSERLASKGRETKIRHYPEVDLRGVQSASQVAGFLACRLAYFGLVSVFVGTKVSANKIASDLVDAYERGFSVSKPISFGEDSVEAMKVFEYIKGVLGEDSTNAKAAELGLLIHHGGIPHGLRLVTEYALTKAHFKAVVCTSTLAQGVNLPVRYLIVASVYQDGEPISIRDFHNLMGRAGRSGSYTEGSVIFADPEIYRSQGSSRGRWSLADRMLDSRNSEPSSSQLTYMVKNEGTDWLNDDQKAIKKYAFIRQEITSFLLNSISDWDSLDQIRIAAELVAMGTFGYSHFKTDEERGRLIDIFIQIGEEVFVRLPNSVRRAAFAKSCLSVDASEQFLTDFREDLQFLVWTAINSQGPDFEFDLLAMLWPYLYRYSSNKCLKMFSDDDALGLCVKWINGEPFPSIMRSANQIRRVPAKELKLGNIVDLCEQGFGYEISMILGTLLELIRLDLPPIAEHIEQRFLLTQKSLKHGVANHVDAILYELGFADRKLVQDISQAIEISPMNISVREVIRAVKAVPNLKSQLLSGYPEYFSKRYDEIDRRFSF